VSGVSAVVLFGSASRGDARHASDIDLLVLTQTGADTAPVRRICSDARPMKVSLVLHNPDSFERLKQEDWLFVKHVADEGTTLWDTAGAFRKCSRVSRPGDHTVVREIQGHSNGLGRLCDLERYGSDFLFPLANVYGLAKRIAMLANSRAGVSIFEREQALRACAELYPAAAPDLQHIAALAPFYAQTRGDRTATPAFSSDDAASELLGSVASLERVIETVSVA
jgi:predicted nucleotidyltransferase